MQVPVYYSYLVVTIMSVFPFFDQSDFRSFMPKENCKKNVWPTFKTAIIPVRKLCKYTCRYACTLQFARTLHYTRVQTILCTFQFSFFTKNEENFKIFAKKEKKLRKNKNDNSNCFYAQIKLFYHKFQLSVVDRNHSRSKTLVWYIF